MRPEGCTHHTSSGGGGSIPPAVIPKTARLCLFPVWSSFACTCFWRLGCGGKEMLFVVAGIVSVVGIPGTGKQIALPGDGAALDMDTVDEAVFDLGSAPVAAPDQPAALGELSQEREISFPRRLSAHDADDIAGQAVVVNAHGSQPGRALVEEFLLAFRAAIGFVQHDFDSHLERGGEYACNELASYRFEHGGVVNAG